MRESVNPAVAIGAAFGLRAEHLKDRLFDFYKEPAYFHELETARPCVLVGGRGTGKTTVLKGLSYEGQRRLRRGEPVSAWGHYGVYLRLETAPAAAFRGSALSPEEWQRLFGHFVNLTLCRAALEFCTWYLKETGIERLLTQRTLTAVTEALGEFDRRPADEQELSDLVGQLLRRFAHAIDSIADRPHLAPTTVGSGVNELLAGLMSADAMQGKLFFFLLDELENLNDDQQQVVNTLIKHCGEHYSFKTGVKEGGWRCKTVLGSHEQLQTPADYERIAIRERLEDGFAEFGWKICQERLGAVAEDLAIDMLDVHELLPSLSEDREAELLGVSDHLPPIRDRLVADGADADLVAAFDTMPPLFAILLDAWATKEGEPLAACVREAVDDPGRWETRYGNNKYALLFLLRKGKRGIRKHYAGFDTYLKLAATNIRLLLQLVEEVLVEHCRVVVDDWATTPVAPDTQTLAAEAVGNSNLVELAGLSAFGPRITRLCASLGRVFHQMADDPVGHAPEVTQFYVSDLPGDPLRVDPFTADAHDGDASELLREAVMHLALIAYPSTKQAGAYVREHDYMVHPMFAPVFRYSYRRKRKVALRSAELLALVSRPRTTINAVLRRNRRGPLDADTSDPQMQLLDRYLTDEA